MNEEDRQSSTVEERISRARERMSMDYDDKPAPRSTVGSRMAGGNRLTELMTGFLGSEAGTRRPAHGDAGPGGLLAGLWLGGKEEEATVLATCKEGRKLMAITDGKTWSKIDDNWRQHKRPARAG